MHTSLHRNTTCTVLINLKQNRNTTFCNLKGELKIWLIYSTYVFWPKGIWLNLLFQDGCGAVHARSSGLTPLDIDGDPVRERWRGLMFVVLLSGAGTTLTHVHLICSRLKSLALNPKICPDNGWLSFWRDQLLAFCSRHWINRFLPGGGLAVSCSRARILNANTVEYCAHSFVTAAIKIPSIAQPRAPLCGTYQTSRCRPPAASGRCRTGWARGELC